MEKSPIVLLETLGKEKKGPIAAKQSTMNENDRVYREAKVEQQGMKLDEFMRFGCKCTG